MTCTVCGQGEFRWVRGANKVVFCNACGLRVNNIDGKIKVPGRPTKEASKDKQASRAETQGS